MPQCHDRCHNLCPTILSDRKSCVLASPYTVSDYIIFPNGVTLPTNTVIGPNTSIGPITIAAPLNIPASSSLVLSGAVQTGQTFTLGTIITNNTGSLLTIPGVPEVTNLANGASSIPLSTLRTVTATTSFNGTIRVLFSLTPTVLLSGSTVLTPLPIGLSATVASTTLTGLVVLLAGTVLQQGTILPPCSILPFSSPCPNCLRCSC